MLLPPTCSGCGATGAAPCPSCRTGLLPAPALPPPPGLRSCAALLAYAGPGRELVARLKYRNQRSALPWLAAAMAGLVDAAAVDVVTWVPTTGRRRRARGYDQARLLAVRVARALGRPCRPLLRRRPGPAQTGRSRVQRRSGPRIETRRGAVPSRVLVVDDVVTTGATLATAARALRSAGAGEVLAVVAARRP